MTGLGVALLLERLTGLDTSPGLYFPYQLLDSQRYFDRFQHAGGEILTLEVL